MIGNTWERDSHDSGICYDYVKGRTLNYHIFFCTCKLEYVFSHKRHAWRNYNFQKQSTILCSKHLQLYQSLKLNKMMVLQNRFFALPTKHFSKLVNSGTLISESFNKIVIS